MSVYTYPPLDLEQPPFVSIIIPAYNEEEYIKQTLIHARNQKYSGCFEVILSDCRSNDLTQKIGEQFADAVVTCPKRNTGAARNSGAKKAKGEFLLFVDADTWLPPHYLEKIYQYLRTHPNVVALSTAFEFTQKRPILLLVELYTNLRFWFADRFKHKAPVLGYNFFIRKDAFFKNGGFKECFFEDFYFYKKLNSTNQPTKYLLKPKVTISARRLQKYGFIKTFVYYNTKKALTERYLFDSWYQPAT